MEKNEIDKNLYNEKTLYLLNIKDLRDIGRKFGVPSPTTLKKEELVDYILKIVYGEIVIEKHHSFGRPSTRQFDINKYLEKIKSKSELTDELIKVKLPYEDTIFKVASRESEMTLCEVKQLIFVEDEGKYYLRERGFVRSENDIEVPETIVKKYNLENFDVVEIVGTAKLFKILTINGETVAGNEIKKVKNPNRTGAKEVFYLRTKEEIKNEILKKKKECDESNVRYVVISTEKYFDGEDMFLIDKNAKHSQIYKNFMQFSLICEKYVYNNEDVEIATDVSELIEDAIDSFDEVVSSRIRRNIKEKIQAFISLGNLIDIYKLEKESIY